MLFGGKRNCKRLKNQGIVSADRISELPEALILQILSHLSTQEAITTSVLSKQWQSLWKLLPKLKFDSCNHSSIFRKFTKNVGKALHSHKAPVLQSLHLNISSKRYNATYIEILIEIAFARNVRELVLNVDGNGGRFKFPKSLYNCEMLKTLELNRLVLMDVLSSVSLSSLRTLHLVYVTMKDDGSLLNFLSGCPNLETLVVYGISYYNVETLTIAVPSLQRLSIYNNREFHMCLVINAPSLKYLTIKGIHGHEFCITENLPELVEANLVDVSAELTNEKLMGSLTSVKRFCLSLPPFKHQYNQKNYLFPRGKWNQTENVPECLLVHLETFMWEGYDWEEGHYTIEVDEYILSKTNRLKRATFISSNYIPCKRRVEMFEDLNSVVRASNSCQILFK